MSGPNRGEADNGGQRFRLVPREINSPRNTEGPSPVVLPAVSRAAQVGGWRGDPAEIVVASEGPSTALEAAVKAAPEWQTRALCIGEPTGWFFPTRGESAAAALEICGRCPVRQECLDEAIADPTLDFGVRGGMSAQARKARRKLARKRAQS